MNGLQEGLVVDSVFRRLKGGAYLNQRSLKGVFEAFAPRPQPPRSMPLTTFLDTLWTLDLMIAHKHVSYDGTLPNDDLIEISRAADEFCRSMHWKRESILPVSPSSPEHQLSFQTDAALDMFLTPTELVPGLDQAVTQDEAARFFGALSDATSDSCGTTGDGTTLERLLTLGKQRFRGSKCVAGIASHGKPAVDQAFAIRDGLGDPALAVGLLINRFRFGYLRRVAWEAGDMYIPGAAWRALSRQNAKCLHAMLARRLEAKFFSKLHAQLGGDDGSSATLLPPVALYCLMSANPAHGPAGLIEGAQAMADAYRTLLNEMTKSARQVELTYGSWTQAVGQDDFDTLNEIIEQKLSDSLGAIDRKVAEQRRGNPSGYDRHLTFFTTILDKGITGVAGAALGHVSGRYFDIDPQMATLAGAALGGVFGGSLVEGVRSKVIPYVRRSVCGHVDAYRKLDNYLGARDAPPRHLRALEEQALQILNVRLTNDQRAGT